MRFYADGIVVTLPGVANVLDTKDAIVAFYRRFRGVFKETLRVDWFIHNGSTMASELRTTFECVKQEGAAFGNGGKWLNFGEKIELITFAHYDFDSENRVLRVRLAKP